MEKANSKSRDFLYVYILEHEDIVRSDREKNQEAGVWGRHCREFYTVTPRSHEYGDVTATYIHRSKIPLRIYAKLQYRKESEYESTVVIYIPTEKYNSMVTTESDTILQEYYITRKYKSTFYEEIYITKAERCS